MIERMVHPTGRTIHADAYYAVIRAMYAGQSDTRWLDSEHYPCDIGAQESW